MSKALYSETLILSLVFRTKTKQRRTNPKSNYLNLITICVSGNLWSEPSFTRKTNFIFVFLLWPRTLNPKNVNKSDEWPSLFSLSGPNVFFSFKSANYLAYKFLKPDIHLGQPIFSLNSNHNFQQNL